jgi:non-structural maintenance of chromosomes element 4
MKGIVAEGEELMPHRGSQAAESTPVSRREPAMPLATQSGRMNRPEPEVPLAAQSTSIKKFCRNQGLVLQDQTVTTCVQKVLEEEMAPAEALEDMEEKMEAIVTQEFMKDKMVENRMEILTYKRRRLF